MLEAKEEGNIYICKPSGEIPVDSIEPGDTLYNASKKHALMYLKNGEILIIEAEDRRREILYHYQYQETIPKKIFFRHAEGLITILKDEGEVPLIMFGPSPRISIPDRKIIFDHNGQLLARDPNLNLDQNHKANRNNYKPKSSFLHGEKLETSKGVLLRSENGKYQLESTEDKKEIILRRVDGKEPVLMRFKGTGNSIESFYFERGDVTIQTDTGSSNGIYSGRFIYSIELSDHGALIARDFSQEIVWTTKRNTLSSTDKTYLKWDDGRLVNSEGIYLTKGSKIESTNGTYAFEFRNDGNAVLYRTFDNHILYETGTKFDGVHCRLTIRDDSLLIEDPTKNSGKPLWESKSTRQSSTPKTCLFLSDEGILSIQTDLSESKQVQPVPEIFWQRPVLGVLNDGLVLRKGEWLSSPNQKFVLSLQEDGNLIIHKHYGRVARYLKGIQSSDILFESCTQFDGQGFLYFVAATGHLYLKNANGDTVWQTNNNNQQVDHGKLLDDGRLQFVDSTDSVLHALTLPKSYLSQETLLKGRNKLISPNFRYLLSIDEHLALDENESSEKLVIKDCHNDWDDVNAKVSGFYSPHSFSSKDKSFIYEESGRSDRITKIDLTDAGLFVITEKSRFSFGRFIALPHCWYGQHSLQRGTCMYSPSRKFGLIVEKNCFVIKNLNNGDILYSSYHSDHDEVDSATFFVKHGLLKFGIPEEGNNAERALWGAGSGVFSRMELGNDGILRVYDDSSSVIWQSLRIACLAWGSLIWDPRDLPMIGGWRKDGPRLRVEFLRQSADGRMTLVLSKHARAVQSEWTLMNASSLEMAIHGLALREGITNTSKANLKKTIGVWPPQDSKSHENKLILDIGKFAKKHDISHVIWTNLGPKDPMTGLRTEPKSNTVINYLLELQKKAESSSNPIDKLRLEKAKEYISRTPLQVNTVYRKEIEDKLGWRYKSESNINPPESD